jgi:pyridoxamine 5'-phosphate oxidase
MSESSSNKDLALEAESVPRDPLTLFQDLFTQAREAGHVAPEAMTLATADAEGRPSARVVLLKQVDQRGFVFYTNYLSRKACEIEANPNGALVFYWDLIDYQVRIEGTLIRTSAEESDAYFQTRPRDSQIGALASPQSQVISDRGVLENRVEELEKEYENRLIDRPAHWGGYLLEPERIEFWKNRMGRLHDRLLYERGSGGDWTITRLAP